MAVVKLIKLIYRACDWVAGRTRKQCSLVCRANGLRKPSNRPQRLY